MAHPSNLTLDFRIPERSVKHLNCYCIRDLAYEGSIREQEILGHRMKLVKKRKRKRQKYSIANAIMY